MIRVDETDPVGELEPSFPYRDVTIRRGVDFKDNYEIQSEIGRGKFGTVYHCKEKTSGLQLAAKVVTTTRKEDRRSVEREVEIMRRLQHPRLIQLYDAIDTGKQIYVILELIQGGELFERVIDDDFVLTERSCAVFMRQICEGIEFVHAQHILHLDMKPENILCLTKEGNRIKIIDFGLARHYDPRKKMQVLFGTPEFVAPEVVNFDQIGFGTDMWSIGVICYVLLSGLSPFMGDTDVETMANVTIAKYDFDHDAFADISEDAKDFIRCLLVKDKEKRATATMCRSHRWLVPKKPPATESNSVAKSITNEITKQDSTLKSKKLQVTSPQIPSGSKDELDVTKDNLRLFVERWREHPNSPYLVETGAIVRDHLITSDDRLGSMGRQEHNNLEMISLRGQSPSPCGSVCSTSSELSEVPSNETNRILAVPNSMVWSLERRASEGNFADTGHRRDAAAQIVLAEEIIKLSEHLRNLAMVQPMSQAQLAAELEPGRTISKTTKEINEKPEKAIGPTGGKSPSNSTSASSRESAVTNGNERNEISEKLSSITRQRNINGTTFNGNRSYEKPNSNVTNFRLKKTFNKPRKSGENNSSDVDEPNSHVNSRSNKAKTGEAGEILADSPNTGTCKNGRVNDPERKVDRLCTNVSTDENMPNTRDIDLSPPWRRARTKHRFNETCRDVPRISTLRDIHKNLNLDEPQSTKDLLLHLLGEWDDTSRPGSIGRKSISVDWCGEQSVARRSMNSLAEYFQSERQRTTPSDVANNTTSASSIHR